MTKERIGARPRVFITPRQESGAQRIIRIVQLLIGDDTPLAQTNIREIVERLIDHCVMQALTESGGNVTIAGKTVGLNRTTIVERQRRKDRKKLRCV